MHRLKAACHSMKLAAPVRAGAAIDLAKQLQQVLGDFKTPCSRQRLRAPVTSTA